MYIIDKRGDEFTNCCTTALKIAPQLARAFFSNYVKVNKMDYFEYHDNILCCDDVDVREIAQDVLIDRVIGEHLGILVETELLQPGCNAI